MLTRLIVVICLRRSGHPVDFWARPGPLEAPHPLPCAFFPLLGAIFKKQWVVENLLVLYMTESFLRFRWAGKEICFCSGVPFFELSLLPLGQFVNQLDHFQCMQISNPYVVY